MLNFLALLNLAWVTKHIYLCTFLGSFLEGELILLLVSLHASRCIDVSIFKIGVIAILSTFFSEQILFFIGRKYKSVAHMILQKKKFQQKFQYMKNKVEENGIKAILLSRFIYGIRIITPVFLGTTNISSKKFFIFNGIASIIWGTVICSAGSFLGRLFSNSSIEHIVSMVEKKMFYVKMFFLGLMIGVILYQILKKYRKYKS